MRPPAIKRRLARIGLLLLVLLLLLAAIAVRPWAPQRAALRPDTGERAAALKPEQIGPVLTELLARVYAAFGREAEGAIYDGLATAVASDLLTDLYLQRRRAQLTEPPERQGRTAIREVTLDDWRLLERGPEGYRIAAEWTVVGELGHEDHRHERVNAYAATLTLGRADGAWRLTAFDLDQVRREEVPLFFGDLDFGGGG